MRSVPTLPVPILAISAEVGSWAAPTPERVGGALAAWAGPATARQIRRVVRVTRRRTITPPLRGVVRADDLPIGRARYARLLSAGLAAMRLAGRPVVVAALPASQDHPDRRGEHRCDQQQDKWIDQDAAGGVAAASPGTRCGEDSRLPVVRLLRLALRLSGGAGGVAAGVAAARGASAAGRVRRQSCGAGAGGRRRGVRTARSALGQLRQVLV